MNLVNNSEENTAELKKQRIWQVVHSIPEGCVATYGQVAALAGIPAGARFAGTSLKGLPKDTRIPWHRVINAQGKLSLPPDSPAFKEQLRRLKSEGVLVKNDKISLSQFQWQP